MDGEHYIFENDIASYYQLDFENPIMTSSYRITQDNPPKLELTDIEKSYVVKFRSDNYVELYSDKSTYTAILRAKEMDSQGSLEGIWKVAYRKTDEVLEEVFEIIDNELVFYRNDMEEPFAISQLVWDGVDVFTAHSLGKTMKVHYVEYDIVQLIETDTGYLWELHRTD